MSETKGSKGQWIDWDAVPDFNRKKLRASCMGRVITLAQQAKSDESLGALVRLLVAELKEAEEARLAVFSPTPPAPKDE